MCDCVQWLYPGRHSYKFRYKLPAALPYSLDGSKYGRIEYKAKATVLIGNGKISESLEEEFFLRSRPGAAEEARIRATASSLPRENVEYGTIGGGCFSKESLSLSLSIQTSKPEQNGNVDVLILTDI